MLCLLWGTGSKLEPQGPMTKTPKRYLSIFFFIDACSGQRRNMYLLNKQRPKIADFQ